MATVRDPVYVDAGVEPGTAYTYEIRSQTHHHAKSAPVAVAVTTPPAGHIDPRRVGVKPLLSARGRGGRGVPIALSYNAQIWRRDGGASWKMARDIGYGWARIGRWGR